MFLVLFSYRLQYLMFSALLDQDPVSLSWRPSKDLARQAMWRRMWMWLSKEFTPSQWQTVPLCPFSNTEHPFGPPQLLLLQRKEKPGTVKQPDNWQSRGGFWFITWCQKKQNKLNHVLLLCVICYNWIFFFCWICMLTFFRAHMFLLRDMMCLSGRTIVHKAAGPTECSCCLQPYGIPWQRTQTFLIESSLSAIVSGQFSGNTAVCS